MVPFGNVCWVCFKNGPSINKLIVSSNSNDILTRFLNRNMEVATIKTLSPMDIQISSNFERLLYNEIKNTDINGFMMN